MQSIVAAAPQHQALYLPDKRVVAVNALSVRFPSPTRTVDPVRKLAFHVDHGALPPILGAPGSGHSSRPLRPPAHS